MRVGMTLPVMEPDLTTDHLETWARAIDEGPFASLCFGERMAFNNPHTATLLGAVSAWTSRVKLVTTVVVPQLHDPVMLAKAMATGDQLSRGRLTVGVGVGGREEDYRAVGADLSTQTRRDLAERVATMRKVWAGEKLTESVLPVGPRPIQPDGPPILVGTMGPKTIADAGSWADGLAGVTLDLDVNAVAGLFDIARASWAAAERPAPHLTTSFWFAFDGDRNAGGQIHRHLRHYMNWLPADLVDAISPGTGFSGTPGQLRDVLRRFADIGADEVHLIPTSTSARDLELATEVAASL